MSFHSKARYPVCWFALFQHQSRNRWELKKEPVPQFKRDYRGQRRQASKKMHKGMFGRCRIKRGSQLRRSILSSRCSQLRVGLVAVAGRHAGGFRELEFEPVQGPSPHRSCCAALAVSSASLTQAFAISSRRALLAGCRLPHAPSARIRPLIFDNLQDWTRYSPSMTGGNWFHPSIQRGQPGAQRDG